MDILTVIVAVLVVEAAIYGICCFVCRKEHVPGEMGTQSKMTLHHSALPPPQTTHVVDTSEGTASPTDRQSNRLENSVRLVCLASRISSLRDCD
jgi:hypothetical protein